MQKNRIHTALAEALSMLRRSTCKTADLEAFALAEASRLLKDADLEALDVRLDRIAPLDKNRSLHFTKNLK